jgi:hypothetical protein
MARRSPTGHQKTRRGRLDALDALVATLDAELLDPDGPFGDAPVVDVGLGAVPWTTVDWFHRLEVPVVGVDHAADAVARAQPYAEPGLSFVEGDLDLPVRGARMVRVLNVLRGGPPEATRPAHALLGQAVQTGGLVLEGSCGPTGDVGTVHRLRKGTDGLHREGLLLWLEPTHGDAPFRFRDRLPRDLRGDGAHPVYGLLGAWMDAYRRLPAGTDRLARAAEGLPDLRMLALHAALWTPSGGVPERTTAALR